jgi:hypothetical protein
MSADPHGHSFRCTWRFDDRQQLTRDRKTIGGLSSCLTSRRLFRGLAVVERGFGRLNTISPVQLPKPPILSVENPVRMNRTYDNQTDSAQFQKRG